MPAISKFMPILRQSQRLRLNTTILYPSCQVRSLSTKNDESSLTKANASADVSTDLRPLGEKIKETTKTISYTGVILAGVGVTGIIFYYVLRELFSSNSPNSIYSAALAKCKDDPRIEDALGYPIKGYGEETTRRRRSHVSHLIYEKEGSTHMRMRFYLKGSRKQGTVELDMKQNESGNYETRYMLVQIDDHTRRVIILEDNRADLDIKGSTTFALPALNLSQ